MFEHSHRHPQRAGNLVDFPAVLIVRSLPLVPWRGGYPCDGIDNLLPRPFVSLKLRVNDFQRPRHDIIVARRGRAL
jgi:hypothetical protein